MQIKLDELIRAVHGARNDIMDAERMEEAELLELRDRFHRLAVEARQRGERGGGRGGAAPRAGAAERAIKPGASAGRAGGPPRPAPPAPSAG